LQVRHPFGSFCAAKVILFFNSTLKGSGFYRNFWDKTAEQYLRQVLDMFRPCLSYDKGARLTNAIHSITPVLIATGKIAEAKQLHKQSCNIDLFIFRDSTKLLEKYRYSIQIAENQGFTDMQTLQKWIGQMRHFIKNHFIILSDNEKTQLMESLDQEFAMLNSVLSRSHDTIANQAFYDLLLLQKSIVLSDTKGFQKRMWALTDSVALQKAFRLYAIMKILNNENADLSERAKMNVEADNLRTILTQTAPNLFQNNWANITWRDVQKQLKENEVAIEIIDFQYHTQTVPTDSIVYYAAVVRKGDAQPTMIRLFEEKQLMKYLQSSQEITTEIHVDSLYIINSGALYELIWQPFENAGLLKEGNTVYLSPSGQLNRIALAALMSPNAINKRFQDLYRLEIVNSTREIQVDAKDKTLKNNDLSALLVGGVQYEADSIKLVQMFKKQQLLLKNQKDLAVRSLTPDADGRICKLDFLEGSLTEIQNIHSYLKTQKKVEADTLTGFSASEDIVRAKLKAAPTIVHLSTHGMYTLPKYRKLTPMQALHNNFILLSGCERATCQGKSEIEGMEDGVLTAAEVADMDLKKTQLVVLSACETGLGDLRGREGVFGLARGFKLAGAKYQLVSLWKVPDAETAEFMQLFYQKALDGTTIQNAFLETQTELSQKYPDKPYNWAAWVLIR
jgi:CHAT domain-containing protein